MATIDDLLRLRPWAYHVTTPMNRHAIVHWRRLRSAYDLLNNSQSLHLLSNRRTMTATVTVGGVQVEIRDQIPLKAGHIRFEKGYSFRHLLDELNRRVFLWPGTEDGPIKYGLKHFARYSEAGPVVVIRCRLESLLESNAKAALYVTRCNSGSPRSNPMSGHAVRGPSTFRLLSEVEFPLSEVKELSYEYSASLPADAEWAIGLNAGSIFGWEEIRDESPGSH